MMLLTLVVLGIDVAPRRPPPAECRADGDCVISVFRGCCGSCCGPEPFATTRENANAAQSRCAAVDCSEPACTKKMACPSVHPPGDYRAVCEAGRCTAVLRKTDRFACDSDSQCRVDWVQHDQTACSQSPCGCCPSTQAEAAHVNQPQPPNLSPPPRPLTKKEGEKTPPYGLTQGNTGAGRPPPPQAPNCSPCPGRPNVRAVCSANRCVLAQPEYRE